jgi:hypothetical protein
MYKHITTLALLMLKFELSYQTCTVPKNQYPAVVGGNNGPTAIKSISHDSSYNIYLGGYSSATDFTG